MNNIIQVPVDRLGSEVDMHIELIDERKINTFLTTKISHLLFIPSFNIRKEMGLENTCIPIIFDCKVSWKNNLFYKVTSNLELTLEMGKKWSIMCPEKYTQDCYFKALPEYFFVPKLFNIDFGESELVLPTTENILKIEHLRKDLSQSDKIMPLTNIMVPHMDEETILEIFKCLVGLHHLFYRKNDVSYVSNNYFFNNYTGIPDLDFILSERDFLKNLLFDIQGRNTYKEHAYRHIYEEIILELFIGLTADRTRNKNVPK